MQSSLIEKQIQSAFNAYVSEGLSLYHAKNGVIPEVSHLCFKFSDKADYKSYQAACSALGNVTTEQFKGKEISWCKLDKPLRLANLNLAWLELVEPKIEAENNTGINNIGYQVSGLKAVEKLSSKDGVMMFRYQGMHANDMAPKKLRLIK
jgi:hypothetical protein